ncbi:MAG TPA: hypothetical protein VKE40_17290 [Gemmataceae bacterium]|nr:hypothetical protein [Gemmataceae bacterium]
MPESVFIVERLNWRPSGEAWLALPGSDRVRTFPDRDVAEADARRREWDVRRRVNPFHCGGPRLHYQTSFDAARLFDWFLDLGLDPPGVTPDSAVWTAWWDRYQPEMTDAQRAAAWEVLDRVRFFRVTESPAGRAMHLVAEPHFEEDPIAFPYGTFRYVGCTPYMLVRTRETADDLCHQLHVARVVRQGGYEAAPDVLESWVRPEPDEFTLEEPVFDPYDPYELGRAASAEHRPLDLIAVREPTPGCTLYVVLRRRWRLEQSADGSWRWSLTAARSCGRPVAAFDTLAAADAYMANLESEARTYPSPFRFGTPHEWGTLHASGIWGVLAGMAPIDFTNMWEGYKAADPLWSRWWDEAVPVMTDEQVETAWALFERLRFYEVVAVEYRE